MLKRFLFTLLALPFTVLIPSEMDAAPKKIAVQKKYNRKDK